MNEFMMFLKEFLGVMLFLAMLIVGGFVSAFIHCIIEIRKEKKNKKRYHKR